jgi:hypothetical protein
MLGPVLLLAASLAQIAPQDADSVTQGGTEPPAASEFARTLTPRGGQTTSGLCDEERATFLERRGRAAGWRCEVRSTALPAVKVVATTNPENKRSRKVHVAITDGAGALVLPDIAEESTRRGQPRPTIEARSAKLGRSSRATIVEVEEVRLRTRGSEAQRVTTRSMYVCFSHTTTEPDCTGPHAILTRIERKTGKGYVKRSESRSTVETPGDGTIVVKPTSQAAAGRTYEPIVLRKRIDASAP